MFFKEKYFATRSATAKALFNSFSLQYAWTSCGNNWRNFSIVMSSKVCSGVSPSANLLPSLSSLTMVALAESPGCFPACQYVLEAYLVVSSTVDIRVAVRMSISSLFSGGNPAMAVVALAFNRGSRCRAWAAFGISLLFILL